MLCSLCVFLTLSGYLNMRKQICLHKMQSNHKFNVEIAFGMADFLAIQISIWISMSSFCSSWFCVNVWMYFLSYAICYLCIECSETDSISESFSSEFGSKHWKYVAEKKTNKLKAQMNELKVVSTKPTKHSHRFKSVSWKHKTSRIHPALIRTEECIWRSKNGNQIQVDRICGAIKWLLITYSPSPWIFVKHYIIQCVHVCVCDKMEFSELFCTPSDFTLIQFRPKGANEQFSALAFGIVLYWLVWAGRTPRMFYIICNYKNFIFQLEFIYIYNM